MCRLWHGNVAQALDRVENKLIDLELIPAPSAATVKLAVALSELGTYIDNNREFIPNFGERYRHGEPIRPEET